MTTIKLKNGSGAPTAGDLAQGEPALDLTNKRLYTEDSGGTVIEVGTNPTSITTGDITATGTASFANLATTGNITFGDNDKAIFGAGSDLQIYHDPANGSYVSDQGVGSLNLLGSTYIRIKDATDSNTAAEFNPTGASAFYYNNAQKLATTSTGIDVTGTVTADGAEINVTRSDTAGSGFLTLDLAGTAGDFAHRVDTSNAYYLDYYTGSAWRPTIKIEGQTGDISFYEDTGTTAKLFWDASAESLGIGTSSPSRKLHVDASGVTALFGNTESNNSIELTRTTSSASYVSLAANSSTAGIIAGPTFTFSTANSGGGAVTERMRIESSGNVGIGTNSPQAITEIVGSNSGGALDVLNLRNSGGDGSEVTINMISSTDQTNTAARSFIKSIRSGSNPHLTFGTANTERMRIDSSGNVGIGTSSPDTMLHLSDTLGGAVLRLERNDTAIVATDQYGAIEFEGQDANAGANGVRASMRAIAEASVGQTSLTFSTAGSGASEAERMRINSSGNVGINTTSPAATLHTVANSGTTALLTVGASGNNIASFYTSGSSQVMTLDSSGNLLVGTTSTTPAFSSTGSGIALKSGESAISADNTIGLIINRNASNGGCLQFRRGGTAVGSVSVSGTNATFNTSSDQRLKDNIVDAPSASDDIDAIQVRSFDWKADGSHQKYGMVAQELQSVAPEAVSGDADSDDMMGVDYSKLVPMLVKEIQSLRARVAQLEGVN